MVYDQESHHQYSFTKRSHHDCHTPHAVFVNFDGDATVAGLELDDDLDSPSETEAEPPPSDELSPFFSDPLPIFAPVIAPLRPAFPVKKNSYATFGSFKENILFTERVNVFEFDETAPLFSRRFGNDGIMNDMEKGGGYESSHGVNTAADGSTGEANAVTDPTVFSSSVNLINTILGTCMMR